MAVLGKPLTSKQAMIWGMKQAGKTQPEIAAELGISLSVVEKCVTRIRRKLGISATDARSTKLLETRESVAGGKMVDRQDPVAVDPARVSNAVDELNVTMKRLGFPERMREATARRMMVKHAGQITAAKEITDPQMIAQYREKIGLAFSYMDDKAMSEASFRDLATGVSMMTEKLQLLEGKPTQIISDHERKKLHELMPLMIAEARRRGVTLDGEVTEKVVGPA